MKRTDAEGHDTNRYTEGNPSLGVPATVVGAEEMNNIQEELANVVEAASITLDGGDENQLLEALAVLVEDGFPDAQAGSQSLLNGAAATTIAGLVFDKTATKSARVSVDLARRTDTAAEVRDQSVELACIYDAENDSWSVHDQALGDDAEVTFSITALGQVEYASSTFAGANYSGTLRFGQVRKVAI